MKPRNFNIAKIAIIFVLLGAGLAGCPKTRERENLIRPVRYEKASSMTNQKERVFSGITQDRLESKLSFKVSGTVKKVMFKVGDRVGNGQVLATLDDTDYRLQADAAQANLNRMESLNRNASSAYERVRALYENKNASTSDLEIARTTAESASAGLAASRKQLELAELQLSYTRLIAPFDGFVSLVNVENNENVAQGYPVLVLNSGSKPEVKTFVPESFIGLVKEGQKAIVRFDAVADRQFPAVVTEVGVSTSPISPAYPVTLQLESDAEQVKSGMAARIQMHLSDVSDRPAILVPSVAVGEDRDGRYVFSVESLEGNLGVAKKRSVEVGDLTRAGVEVFSGISEGDLVVTAGIDHIEDGMQVRILR